MKGRMYTPSQRMRANTSFDAVPLPGMDWQLTRRVKSRKLMERSTSIDYNLFDAKGDFIHGWTVDNYGDLDSKTLQFWDKEIIERVEVIRYGLA